MVFFVRAQILGRIVLSSTLHIALVCLRVSSPLFQGVYSHTEKHMRGQRMRQKITTGYHQFSQVVAGRAQQFSVHALSQLVRSFSHFLFLRHRIMCWQGAAVQRACAAATRSFVLTLFIFKAPNYVLAKLLNL